MDKNTTTKTYDIRLTIYGVKGKTEDEAIDTVTENLRGYCSDYGAINAKLVNKD